MAKDYERIIIPIANLYLHPTNARYALKSDLKIIDKNSDRLAIERMVGLNETHIEYLLPDVANNGLLPSQLPIISPINADNSKYIVYDANRRITTLKLLLIYKDTVDTFKIPTKIKTLVKSLSYNGPESLLCVSTKDMNFINEQLRKIHTDDLGITQVKWSPRAKDYHLAEEGTYSNRYIIDIFLSFSKHTTKTAQNNLKINGWRSLLDRFVNDPDIVKEYFGIEFDTENGKMTMFYKEKQTALILSSLVDDMKKSTAVDIAQTKDVRTKFLADFRQRNPLSEEDLIDNLLVFNAVKNKLEKTTIKNPISISPSEPASKTPDTGAPHPSTPNPSTQNPVTPDIVTQNPGKPVPVPVPSPNTKKKTQKFLIENPQFQIITDNRAYKIYEELTQLSVNSYPNSALITFRSLFDITIHCYLEKCGGASVAKLVQSNAQLENKFKKSIEILQQKYSKSDLEKNFFKVYEDYSSTLNNKISTIKIFNAAVHNKSYHFDPDDALTVSSNYLPFIHFLWNEIN
ncbi:TonB system transport protein TonB [Acetobacterium woodii]|uniref:Uncharacterized protein n=1 Tax=Acetobacterium woodii (strain ATCC 29683 / DSM 1030 / JCM 2381 / KCTC 1655 / WB1) TaxID=931626 RepID=H6LFB9_ACEWD|nr:TonB system transport protein TonB [Acetobacterium woodii]AFA48219.1 hypothetical protein Awo_c14360 [Acetobacterium woodii DSM 1030]